jgi:hypothetical protein
VVHLGDAKDVVLVRGEVRDLGHPKDLPQVIDAFADPDFCPPARRDRSGLSSRSNGRHEM